MASEFSSDHRATEQVEEKRQEKKGGVEKGAFVTFSPLDLSKGLYQVY